MSWHEQAELLITMGRKNLKALRNMTDPVSFDDETFGFHAQQAIEKFLKAWLAKLEVEYPFTHDLRSLLVLLKARDQEVARFYDIFEFSDYAVRFRYEESRDYRNPLDRAQTILRVEEFLEHVQSLLDQTG